MARTLYGGTDAATAQDKAGNWMPGAVIEVRDAVSLAVLTDLVPAPGYDGVPFPTGKARADVNGVVSFQGPDGFAGEVDYRALNALGGPGPWMRVSRVLTAGDLDAATDAAVLRAADAGTVLTPDAADAAYVPLSQKGATSGVASLNSGGKVPDTQLPPYATPTDLAAKANADQVPTLDEMAPCTWYMESLPTDGLGRYLLTAPYPLRVSSFSLVTGTAVAADATNYLQVRLRRIQAGLVSTFATKTTKPETNGEAIVGAQDWNFDNIAFTAARDLAKGDHIVLAVDKFGTAPAALVRFLGTLRVQPL